MNVQTKLYGACCDNRISRVLTEPDSWLSSANLTLSTLVGLVIVLHIL
jgi:hypothetical protein